MKLKKLFAGVVAAAMIATMSFPAFATVSVKAEPVTEVTFTKNLTVTNDGTTAPSLTYKFVLAPSSAVDGQNHSITMPGITGAATDGSKVYETTAPIGGDVKSGSFTLDLSDLNIKRVGIYKYTVTEVSTDKVAGITYATALDMKVSAVNGENGIKYYVALREQGAADTDNTSKIEATKAFTNTYNAGTLKVEKTVNGNMSDHDQYFTFKVVFDANGYDVSKANIGVIYHSDHDTADGSAAPGNQPAKISFGDEGNTFYLKHGDTIAFTNVPYGVTYTVEETDKAGYTATGEVTTANEFDQSEEDVAIVNTLGDNILDTGVILDNAPYMLMLAVVAGGAMMLVIKKRREEE